MTKGSKSWRDTGSAAQASLSNTGNSICMMVWNCVGGASKSASLDPSGRRALTPAAGSTNDAEVPGALSTYHDIALTVSWQHLLPSYICQWQKSTAITNCDLMPVSTSLILHTNANICKASTYMLRWLDVRFGGSRQWERLGCCSNATATKPDGKDGVSPIIHRVIACRNSHAATLLVRSAAFSASSDT